MIIIKITNFGFTRERWTDVFRMVTMIQLCQRLKSTVSSPYHQRPTRFSARFHKRRFLFICCPFLKLFVVAFCHKKAWILDITKMLSLLWNAELSYVISLELFTKTEMERKMLGKKCTCINWVHSVSTIVSSFST